MGRMITPQMALRDLSVYGSSERPLSATWYYEKYRCHYPDASLDSFRRAINRIFRDYMNNLLEMQRNGLVKPYRVICASNDGYFLAETKEQAKQGLEFHKRKIMPGVRYFNDLRRYIENNYPLPVQGELF